MIAVLVLLTLAADPPKKLTLKEAEEVAKKIAVALARIEKELT